MKKARKVFEMNDHELRSALTTVKPYEDYLAKTKSQMQEELTQWVKEIIINSIVKFVFGLLMQGLSVSHIFLFYEDDDGVLWLLNRSAEDGCKCCNRNDIIHKRGEINPANAKIDPVEVVIYRPSPSSSQQNNKNPAELSIEGLSSSQQQQPSFTGFRKKTSKIHANNSAHNVITQQPLPLSDEQKSAMSKQTSKKADEKTPNCCRLCCIECGTCCVGLLNNS